MHNRKWLAAGAVVVTLVALAFFQVQQTFAGGRAMILPVDPVRLVAMTNAGERFFTIEVADDGAKRSAGLMFREDMADNHGMLFVFQETRAVAFWMKNTPMPLDLIFIGQDGRVRAIKQGEPQSPALIAPAEPVRFVLELKAGTAARDGIKDGDLLKHPVIDSGRGG